MKGFVQGRADNAEFVPNIFIQHRTNSIAQFFNQNGYIGIPNFFTLFFMQLMLTTKKNIQIYFVMKLLSLKNI